MKSLGYLALLILMLVSGCKDHQETVPKEVSDILGLKIDRPLEVVLATPQGTTTQRQDFESVSVVFNQPMKALDTEAGPVNEPFSLEPKTAGRFRWKGAATVSFEPREPLRFGTEYTVTVPAGTKAPNGNTLKSDYRFKFTTPGPQLAFTVPKTGDRKFRPGDSLFFVFDQPVEPQSVKSKARVTSSDHGVTLEVRSPNESEFEKLNKDRKKEEKISSEQVVVVTPKGLKPASTFSMSIDPGLIGKGGTIASKRSELFALTTLGPLKLVSSPPSKPLTPEDGVTFEFNNQVSAEILKKNLKVSPSIEIPISEYDAEDTWNRHTLYLALEPNQTYQFTLGSDLSDDHGQKLGKELTFTWKTGDRSPIAQMADGVAVLEARGPLTIPLELRNIVKVDYRMVVLDRELVVDLVKRENTDWLWGEKPVVAGKPFTVNNLFLPNAPKNQTVLHNLDLKEALGSKKFGFVYYQVEMKGSDGSVSSRRGLAQVTNLAVTGKFSPENTLLAATELHSGKPLAGVQATLLDPLGRPVWNGVSQSNGLLEGPGWSKLLGESTSYSDSAPPLFAFLKQGEDEAFVQNFGFGAVYSWQIDMPQKWNGSAHYLTAQVYSERGLYQPGDQVHLRGSLRDRSDDKWVIPDVKELSFEVFNSRDQKVDQGKVKLSEFGTFHHTLSLNEKSATGAYRVDYKIDSGLAKTWKVSEQVTGATFRVEDFEPAQFEVEVDSELKAVVMGQELPFKASAKWLFGSPMVDSKIDWTSRVEPVSFTSKEHPGFQFGPAFSPEDDADDTKVLHSDSARTSGSGELSGKIKLDGIPYRGDAVLIVEATVASSNRRSMSGSLTIPVSRGEFRIGLKPASTFLPAESRVQVQLVTLDPGGEPVSGKSVKTELVKRKWNSVKKTDVDGSFRWISEVKDEVVWQGEQRSTPQAKSFELTPKEPGYYLIRATAKDSHGNDILSEAGFYSYGTGPAGWSISDDDTIDLVTDKTTYQPGETAKVMVKNVFSGEVTALVTYERDKILHSYVTTLKGGTPVLEVPLTQEHIPNLFVSVMLFRGRVDGVEPQSGQDEGKPAFKVGYANLSVAPDSKRLKVSIETEKERYGPKDEVVAKLKVTDSQGKPVKAELSLTAADVGVLNLINFQTPDLFETYYGTLPLGVQTSESRRDVIGQRSYGAKGENQGGGGGYNAGLRKDFRATAVWEPSVVTDEQGLAEVRFELPENLTTFRMMATAITTDTLCGSGEREIINTKPLVLSPSSPAFARLHDEFEAGVLVSNTGDTGTNVTVEMRSEGVDALLSEPRQVYLKAKEEREVLFKFKAQKQGEAVLQFSAKSNNGDDGVEYRIPLKNDAQRVTLAHTGHLDEGEGKQSMEVPSTALGQAELKIDLSSSILRGLEKSVVALLDYPHGCLEQRLSRMVPLLLADRLVNGLQLTGWNSEKVKVRLQENLNQIPTYAHTNGGLKLWPGSQRVHPYLTAQAVKTAHIAKREGYSVKGNWLSPAHDYLKAYLEKTPSDTLELSEVETLECQVAALDALTESGFAGKSYLSNLLDKRSQLTQAGKAQLLVTAHRLGDKKAVKLLAQELTNGLKLENATAYFPTVKNATPWLFNSDVRDTGLVLEALLRTEQAFPVADKVVTWLLDSRKTDGSWGTTANNASALAGLVAYSERHEGKASDFKVRLSLDGKDLKETELSKNQTQASVLETLTSGTHELALSKVGQGRLYYSIALSYDDTNPSPAVDEGLTVLRSVTNLDGEPVTQLQGGQLYKVTLSVIAPELRHYVLLEDPIPAGLTVVKTDFATESSQLSKLLERGSQPSWMTFHRFEDYADKVLLFADALAPGEHTYQYLVRATTPGTYLHPAAQAEEMYHPELFGRTGVSTIKVK